MRKKFEQHGEGFRFDRDFPAATYQPVRTPVDDYVREGECACDVFRLRLPSHAAARSVPDHVNATAALSRFPYRNIMTRIGFQRSLYPG